MGLLCNNYKESKEHWWHKPRVLGEFLMTAHFSLFSAFPKNIRQVFNTEIIKLFYIAINNCTKPLVLAT